MYMLDRTAGGIYTVINRSTGRLREENMARPSKKESENQRPLIDMKSHILTVAEGLVTEKGVKDTSLKDIAKTAGISKGTLYYYYSAKEDIIYDIADRSLSRTTDELIAWVNSLDYNVPADQVLSALLSRVLDSDTRIRLHIYLINEAAMSNSALAEKFVLRYQVWKETIKLTLDRLCEKNRELNSALSTLILAAIDGLGIQKICGGELSDVKDIVEVIINSIEK